MTVWRDWAGYRRFQKLPASARSIAFYSETHQDWHHLQPSIDFLIERLARPLTDEEDTLEPFRDTD